jgi:hypothetical protein
MKILYCFSTTEADEPEAVDQFIAGYELAGGTWTGTMTVLENISTESLTESFLNGYIQQGYEVLIRNTAGQSSGLANYIFAKENGMLLFFPGGDNAFIPISDSAYPYFENEYAMITCGAGLNGTNQTSYPCLFFDACPSDVLGGVPYQSYSTPYIAGKMVWTKEQRGGDWDDTIGACIVTASEGGVFDSINGYGIISVTGAGDSLIDINLEAPELVLSETSVGNVGLIWNIIPFADSYEVYFRGELLGTTTAHVTYYNHALSYRQDKCRKNFYEVRAVRNGTYSEFSNKEEYNYYYNTGILVKSYA